MRRIFTVLAVTAVLSAVAACGDAASPGASAGASTAVSSDGSSAPSTTTGTATTDCAEIGKLVADATAKVREELRKAPSASDADLETSRQTVKKLYTDVATAAQSAAGKQADPTLKAALDTLVTEATSAATGLDSQPKALTALALLDRSKVEAAATRVTQLCS